MKTIIYYFIYNKIKFLNALVIEDVFTEHLFNSQVNKILKQVKAPSSAIDNIEEYSFIQIITANANIETYFDKYTIVDAVKYIVAKLVLDAGVKVQDNLDLSKYIKYDYSDIESVYNYPVIHIIPSRHEEFTFSIYPIYHSLDCTDKIVDAIINHLISSSILVSKDNKHLKLFDQSESILIKSSMYDKKITIGFVSKNDIKMSLRSKIALILDTCVFNDNTYNSNDE